MTSIQRMGKFLSKIILPNISVFIIWGLLTALFIPTGWFPSEKFTVLVAPMAKYLIPLLIGYSGGRLVYDNRGGILGASVTFGLIMGSEIPMFVGAMLVGPLAGLIIKKFDQLIDDKTPSGFEMLISNFSAGLIGLGLTMVAFIVIGPVINLLTELAGQMIKTLIEKNIIVFSSIIIEPAKILFLNNIVNHGVLSPLGLMEAVEDGKSLLFLLETNPGPGLGVLLAYNVFGSGIRKHTAPSVAIIHFFGGIHEVYFPFVLANPVILLPVIIGGFTGNVLFQVFGVGLTATPSPGSIISILALAAKGDHLGILIGILGSTGITFLLSALVIRKREVEVEKTHLPKDVQVIAFACDAGMGSSVMGARKFEKQLGRDDMTVIHCPVDEIPDDVQMIITHKSLMNRIEITTTPIIGVEDFINSPIIEEMIMTYKDKGGNKEMFFKKEVGILTENRIYTGLAVVDKYQAIKNAGQALLEAGLIEADYIPAMEERENIATTYIGSSVAIPHGTSASKKYVKRTGIVFMQYPEGVDFGDGNLAKLVIGIAASGDEHMDILMKIADAVSNNDTLEFLCTEASGKSIMKTFVKSGLGG